MATISHQHPEPQADLFLAPPKGRGGGNGEECWQLWAPEEEETPAASSSPGNPREPNLALHFLPLSKNCCSGLGALTPL